MTAPGNTVLIVTLLAAFLACTGYAAGRLHQRRQTGRDRAEAYRDGYDTATRSVFSLAARIIGPRRSSARGSAAVKPPANGGATPPLPPLLPPPPAASPPPPTPPVLPADSVGGRGPVSLRPAVDVGDLGFPVPPPPPPAVVAEPAAVGGVTYRPFPDPRLPEDSSPGPAAAGERPSRRGAIHRASEDGPDVVDRAGPGEGDPGGAGDETPASSGRHTVPDELVRATTYRLPPDRIFRAKVRESPNSPGLPEEQTTRLVPKPRQS